MAFYRARGLRDITQEVTTSGIGIGGGFIVGGTLGRLVENMLIKTPVTDASSLTDKLMAWAANNGSKAVLYGLAKRYDAGSTVTHAATEALAGSIVYDTVLRLANHGYNPADVQLSGYRILGGANGNVNKLVQENSLLRTELNKALQRMAGTPAARINDMPGYTPDVPHPETGWNPDFPHVRYGAGAEANGPYGNPPFRYSGPPSPAVEARQRQYGQMTTEVSAMPWQPDVMERQRRYGQMPGPGWTPPVIRDYRRVNQMPFQQSQEKTIRQRAYNFAGYTPPAIRDYRRINQMPFQEGFEKQTREGAYGFMAYPTDNWMYSVYGMR